MPERKIILYIACSLDGFIAAPEDNLDFLSIVEKPGEDYGYNEFIKSIDTVIMGKRTYDWIKVHAPEFIHEITTYVYTRSGLPSEGNIIFYNGDLNQLAQVLKSKKTGKNIFCEGGAVVANTMLKDDHIDEFIISIIPVILGKGIRLFGDEGPEVKLELISVKEFETGLIQLYYKKRSA
ncbi:MAG TPA: dihydrofolate reductase family protein [Bacteroidales bacterium]|jgi:dihydrofolate reductase|nr:dihydrofolate reductase family protein [Bacteroidales bacterium]